jgi:polyphosphate kinase
LNELLIPQLAEQNIRFIRRHDWTDRQQQWLKTFFRVTLNW